MSDPLAAEDTRDATAGEFSAAISRSQELYVPQQVIPASVRVIHWVNALCILLLAATGFLVSRTFPLGEVSPAGADFLMVNRQIHIVASLVIILSLLSRLVLAFVGPELARWAYLLPLSGERRRNLVESLAYYLFLRREHPEAEGYNALQGLAYAGLYGMLFLIAVTGLFLVSSGEYVGFWSLGFGWLGHLAGPVVIEQARWIHRVLTWLILLFAAVHLYLVFWYELAQREVTISSIISVTKYVPVSHVHERDERRAQEDE